MDERIREMRLKLDKIAWEPEQSEKNKRAFDFIVVYSDYLIQQAEKMQELETLLHGSKLMTDEALETIEKLQKQNQRYKEALEEIAKEIYLEGDSDLVTQNKLIRVILKARQALGGDGNA